MNALGLRSRASIVVAAAMVASGSFAGVASAATSGPASSPHPAAYPGAGTMSTALSANLVTTGPLLADACTPYVDGDHAHLSSGDVSAHGWWYRNTCPNEKTTVRIYLYEYFSDQTWHFQSSGSAYVWPGGGSGNRATARQVCEGVALAGWRSLIAVSIGNGASAYTPAQNLNCTHW